MFPPGFRTLRFFVCLACLPAAATLVSPLAREAFAVSPRAERLANRVAERRYARVSIAEARVARAEARVAEIAPAVPVPPPPRPATVRRLARAGVPLGGPTPPGVAAAPRPQRSPSVSTRQPTTQPRAGSTTTAAPANETVANPPTAPDGSETGAWTLDPDPGVAPAAAELAPDGTRSVLAAGGKPTPQPTPPTPPSPAVVQPPVELLPTPEAK